MRGRKATPSPACTRRRIVSSVGISTSMFSGTLWRWNSRSTTSRYGDSTLWAMNVSFPSSAIETLRRFASRCFGETMNASASV